MFLQNKLFTLLNYLKKLLTCYVDSRMIWSFIRKLVHIYRNIFARKIGLTYCTIYQKSVTWKLKHNACRKNVILNPSYMQTKHILDYTYLQQHMLVDLQKMFYLYIVSWFLFLLRLVLLLVYAISPEWDWQGFHRPVQHLLLQTRRLKIR